MDQLHESQVSAPDLSRAPIVSLDDVLTTENLGRRPARAPDHKTESQALQVLAQELATRPQNLLQMLVETVVDVCRTDSAGISIHVPDEENGIFRWVAVAGEFAHNIGGSMPRDHSPCGTVIDRDMALLFERPHRYFEALAAVEPPIVENLLVPFYVEGRAVGTLWAIGHTPERRFDAEDVRLLTSLSRFASAGYQLARSLEAAEQASRAKSQFLAVMSHELRTPLTGVIGFADLLETEVYGAVTAEQQEALGRIKATSWHLVSIIDEILTLSRAEAGKERAQYEEADVAEIIRDVVGILASQAEIRGLGLRLDGATAPLPVRIDPGKVRQILINLVGNAIRYTEQGEVTVSLDRSDPEWLVLHVRDTGRGIPPEDQARIFDAFTQLDSSHKRAVEGTGLGLTICRRLARLLGGDVTLRSTPGKGSVFTLRVPRRDAQDR